MKNIITIIVALTIIQLNFGQLITPFTIRYQTQQKGGMVFLSNSAVTCNGAGGCVAGQNEFPPAGAATNDGFTAAYIDIDSDVSTFMSSSDSLSLPSCSEISWAGLYWGAENQSGHPSYANRNQVRLKVDNGTYTTLIADDLQDNTVGFTTYHCFKNITSILQANGLNARYTLANVAAEVGGPDMFGGWTIVVVYKNDLMTQREFTVFNGLSNVSMANPITDISISGFLTPVAGPVNFELGIIGYDGDRNSTGGESLEFNGNGSFVSVFDAINPASDIFNSTIGSNGTLNPYRNPSYTNTLGYEADIFMPNNAAFSYLGNNDNSAIIRQTTGGESFLTQVVSSTIDIYEPDLRASLKMVDLNNGTILPGDTLEYTLTGKNIGSDPSLNTIMLDTLEPNIVFVPGSMIVTYGPNAGPKTDVVGDDQGEYDEVTKTVKLRTGSGANGTSGGLMVNSPTGTDSTQFKFRVIATDDCVALSCDNTTENQAYILGTGNASGNASVNESDPGTMDGFGCPVSGPTTSTINITACSAPSDSSFSACDGDPFTVAYNLPGYTYYDDTFTAVTTTDTTGTFYAIHVAYTGCSDTVVITITSIVDCDLDNDGLSNYIDSDDDNDGLPDTIEGSADIDGDGTLDTEDIDSDNDGITDVTEAKGLDVNGDGRIDGFVDTDNDGLANSVDINNGGTPLANPNSDGDGRVNAKDLDSDDDGITDVREALGADPDNNGQIGTGTGAGIPDSDNDGLADAVDPDNGGTMLTIPNTDAIGENDYVDIDSDSDGIADNIEGQPSVGYLLPTGVDGDNDGLSNSFDLVVGFGGAGIIPVNTDASGLPDYRDTDTDNDADMDALEGWDSDNNGAANTIPSGADTDNDGLDNAYDNNDAAWIVNNGQLPTSFPNLDNTATTERDWREILDNDLDGTTDIVDLDNDNDGIQDSTEMSLSPGGGDADGDGNPDWRDRDSDNDGIADIIEAGGADLDGDGEVDAFTDTNNDGFDDNIAANPLPLGNLDGDQFWNGTDLDSDNDGIADVREAGGADPDNNGQIGTGTGLTIPDTDNDGFSNLVDTDNGGAALPRPNTDGIGRADYLDLDSDQDGIVDNIEGQATISYSAPLNNDADGDGILDPYDNISGFGAAGIIPVNTEATGSPDYADTNTDDSEESDAIEAWDTDNNGTANTLPSGADTDGDGIDNNYDANDVLWNPTNGQTPLSFPNLDVTATVERDWRESGVNIGLDSDGDGVADVTDIDDDNDGILDTVELATALNGDDTDLDAILDNLDLDSDNDGIYDVIEAGGTDSDDNGIIGTGAVIDTDGDGWSNITDSDNGGTALPNPDTDGDGRHNFQDFDSDADTVLDAEEKDPFLVGGPLVDTDGDGIPNYIDINDDNDNILTTNEADEDNDGFWDDCDGDGIPDYLDPDNCGLSIPNGFSPNGDGINDEFVINGLGVYPGTKVSIFNRWGNRVFHRENYNNDWNGTSNQDVTIGGSVLPIGTYFYVVDLNNGQDPLSGYIYLNK